MDATAAQPSPTVRRRIARAAYVGVSLLVILASAWVLARRVQAPAWPAAAAALADRVGPDEAVLLLPGAARLEARHFEGLPVLAALPPGGLPARLAGLWVVAGPGHDPAALAALVARHASAAPLPVAGFAPEELTVVRLSDPLRPAYSLVGGFRDAEVWRARAPGGAVERCERLERGKRDCGGPWWRDIGPHTAPFGGEKERAIWLHPVHGWTTVLRYPALPRGERLVLRLLLDDDARRVRREKGLQPVQAQVRLGDAAPRTVALTPDAPQQTLVLDLPAAPAAAPAPSAGAAGAAGAAAPGLPLVIEATVPDDDDYANLYVTGEVLR